MTLKALHSPSCIFYKNDLYVAFYAGEKECVKQRVLIFKKEKNKFILFKQLPEGSGNPVLMTFNDKLYCCYSVFTKKMQDNVFDLWKTTYVCVQDLISEKDDKYVLSTYCCPRINPFYFTDGSLILPCYDEGIERGILFQFRPGKPMERYVCMSDFPVIQPSLVKKDGKMLVFFRNFKKGIRFSPSECFSPFCEMSFSLAQKTIIFGPMKNSGIVNNNESIATINDKEGNALVIYNSEKERKLLTLGFIEYDKNMNVKSNPMLVLNETSKASYPNCCFNNKNQLVISFTSYEKGINEGSSICVVTVSTKYDKILNRKYITPDMIHGIR